MKQVLQSIRSGETEVCEVPCPSASPGHLLIRTHTSLISAGTERMLIEFGKASLLNKARQQPERVRMVLDKIRTDGLWPTIAAVRSKLEQPLAMGYCNVGRVIDVGDGAAGFEVGDRVVSNGPHSEIVCVGKNLCAKLPESVDDEAGTFTVLGAIALQGIRLAEPTLGESFAVFGLGLVGLLSVQLLRAHGCRVLGIDLNSSRLKLAAQLGAETVDLSSGEDPVSAATQFSRGRGIDGVLIAAATKSNQPIHQAALMCRKRGRIVLIGTAGMELSRALFYEKELAFRVSCSYGPGRYDPAYEEHGHDYPPAYVRWTEQRNFEAVIDMLAEKRIDVAPLISHRFALERAGEAYTLIQSRQPSLGIVLNYRTKSEIADDRLREQTVRLRVAPSTRPVCETGPVVGFLGAGNFATRTLIPAFQQGGAKLAAVASQTGRSALHAARKFDMPQATADNSEVLGNSNLSAVVIATRHDTHAELVCEALKLGKHVFVEKPLALNPEELTKIVRTYAEVCEQGPPPVCMVGFNRRFAPHVQKIAALLQGVSDPKSFILTVNAGSIPAEHWAQHSQTGGGRIIGEGCHFIDLLRFLCGHPIIAIQATMIGADSGASIREDKLSFTLQFADGSFGTVHYLANGHHSFPKERLDVFCAGRVIQLDNFRRLKAFGWPGFRKMNLWRQDKGHVAEVKAFLEAIERGEPSPIPFDELIETTQASFDVLAAAHSGETVRYTNPRGTREPIRVQSPATQTVASRLARSA